MRRPSELIATYIAAKDGNRPWLMRRAFAEDAHLEMLVKTEAVSFPSSTTGVDAITDVLVRGFSREYENVYTICFLPRPETDSRHFSCSWLVGMSQRNSGEVRVGAGRYEWSFTNVSQPLVERLRITIEVMRVGEPANMRPIMGWLSALPYPWCSKGDAFRAMPRLQHLRDVAEYLGRCM